MSAPKVRSRSKNAPVCRVLVCLLLAGLFLHNPFLGASGLHEDLAVCHPPSHRATVGSSELEQFQPGAKAVAPLPDLAVREAFGDLATASFPVAQHFADFTPPVVRSAGFSLNLWFRPPPAI